MLAQAARAMSDWPSGWHWNGGNQVPEVFTDESTQPVVAEPVVSNRIDSDDPFECYTCAKTFRGGIRMRSSIGVDVCHICCVQNDL